MRVQLSRKKGWRMPPNTVSVARPGQFGNPARVVLDQMIGTGNEDRHGNEILQGPWACLISRPGTNPAGWWFASRAEATAKAIEYFRFLLTEAPARHGWQERVLQLRGKNLACWCPIISHGAYCPCHADVLLSLANDIPLDEVINENTRRAKGQAL